MELDNIGTTSDKVMAGDDDSNDHSSPSMYDGMENKSAKVPKQIAAEFDERVVITDLDSLMTVA